MDKVLANKDSFLEKVLRAKYKEVDSIGQGLYMIKGPQPNSCWDVYSSKKKSALLSGFHSWKRAANDTIILSYRITSFIFSVKTAKVVLKAEGDLEKCEDDYYIFWKNGCGVFSLKKGRIIIQPIYKNLFHLDEGIYYGEKMNPTSGKESYFFIRVSKSDNVKTEEIEKIA